MSPSTIIGIITILTMVFLLAVVLYNLSYPSKIVLGCSYGYPYNFWMYGGGILFLGLVTYQSMRSLEIIALVLALSRSLFFFDSRYLAGLTLYYALVLSLLSLSSYDELVDALAVMLWYSLIVTLIVMTIEKTLLVPDH